MTGLAYASTALGVSLGVDTDPFLGAAWCLYVVALRHVPKRRETVWVSGMAVVAVLSAVVGVPDDPRGAVHIAMIGVAAAVSAWLLGRSERERLAAARTAALRDADGRRLEHQLTLSRDLHDGVGHSLSVIRAEADLALAVPDAGESDLRGALRDIEVAAREALVEVQSVLRSMRDEASTESVSTASEVIPRLVAGARAAGLVVASHVSMPSSVPAEIDTVVARVVQEALTNVLRHASARSCEVTVGSAHDVLRVRVSDDGVGSDNTDPRGSGLLGMRERVHAVGGTVTVTSPAGGGTTVEASIPVRVRR